MDTIFALASARGKAGVAVIRVSGPAALGAVEALAGSVTPRRPVLRKLSDDKEVLDEALVMTFPAPGSFTGEDVAEFHLHGSVATVAAVSRVLGGMPGLRPAEAGEFTRRALENEKLDLAQIEGLADLVEAETEAQRRQALRVLSGVVGAKAEVWRSRLIRAAALIEATIDFADEEVPTDVSPEVFELIRAVHGELMVQAAGVDAAERVRTGFEVAIVGPPNIGKSTLLNALAGRDAAITSEIAGTTRDVIEVRMDLRGLPVTILDTAGIRETGDMVEAQGVARARERADQADLRVILTGPDRLPVMEPESDDMVLQSKSDLGTGDFSALSGEGLDGLVDRITSVLENRAADAGIAVRERHRVAMLSAVSALESAQDRLESEPELAELIAEDLRAGVRALDSLVGHVGVEDLLDEIFSSFCIGK